MQIPSWAGPAAEQLWSWVAVAVVVYLLGETSKRVAVRLGWRGRDDEHATLYDLTLSLQPIFVGALFGLVPLPTLHAIDGLAKDPDLASAYYPARLLWFSMAGAFCGQVYSFLHYAATEGRSRVLMLLGARDVPGTRTVSVPATVAKILSTPVPAPAVAHDPSPSLATALEPDDGPPDGAR